MLYHGASASMRAQTTTKEIGQIKKIEQPIRACHVYLKVTYNAYREF